MTGNGLNNSNQTILIGMPVAEDENGNLRRASNGDNVLAVATDSGDKGSLVNYATNGMVERQDWFMLIGAHKLNTGQAYYLGDDGKLVTSGALQVGIARSPTVMRIKLQVTATMIAQVWPVSGAPLVTMGKLGDLAYDFYNLAIYGPKTAQGWGLPAYLTTATSDSIGQITFGDPTTTAALTPGRATYDDLGNLWVFVDNDWNLVVAS